MTSRASIVITVVLATLAGTVVACGADPTSQGARKSTTSNLEEGETESAIAAEEETAPEEAAAEETEATETEATEPVAAAEAPAEFPADACNSPLTGEPITDDQTVNICDRGARTGYYVCASGVPTEFVACDSGKHCIYPPSALTPPNPIPSRVECK